MMKEAIGLAENETAARPEDEAVLNFVAAPEMGRIYYRAALAYKALGDLSEARPLLRVAAVYLPNDENVQKEIAACALRLG
jgi:tetratricopeptide (TPR) repeat protein